MTYRDSVGHGSLWKGAIEGICQWRENIVAHGIAGYVRGTAARCLDPGRCSRGLSKFESWTMRL